MRRTFFGIPILQLIFIACTKAAIAPTKTESTEALYRKTVSNWRSQRSWQPWIDFTQELLQRFDSVAPNSNTNRLEYIGGFEEGILSIERTTVARGAGIDVPRDEALSHLYTGYGRALMQLTPDECYQLALDPHTLLIGAETIKADEEVVKSTHLCVENAENALRNAATLDATNQESVRLLETITGSDDSESVHKRKPKEFVAELFDSFADTFDEVLLDTLEYKVPALVGEAAKSVRSEYRALLDAGCGTGLAGRILRPIVSDVIVGVDASQKMLDIAAKCTTTLGCGLKEQKDGGEGSQPLYDSLLQMDLEDMTIANTLHTVDSTKHRQSAFDIIVAADVLVYFGNLRTVLKTFQGLSSPGAALIFSCERTTEEEAPLGYRLLSSGRFAHTKKHAVDAASDAGYDLLSYEEIVPRIERGEEVKGHLFAFVLKDGVHTEL